MSNCKTASAYGPPIHGLHVWIIGTLRGSLIRDVAAKEVCPRLPQAEKERRRVAKERKEVQQKKNLKMEKISNPATIKRMMKSKKQRKLLVTADPSA